MLDPTAVATVSLDIPTERSARVRHLLEVLSGQEVMALAASTPLSNRFRWASLGPEAGLTEDQEDFVDYWSPTRVLRACQAKRELIAALDEWAVTTEATNAQEFAAGLLARMVAGDIDDN